MKQLLSYMLNASIFLLSFTVIAQELPEIIPPSPTVASLMEFEEVPISYYTGQPNISIPIYSKALNGDLSMSIGLSYNTQGIKLDSRSGWTGTGWSLNAGGSISRTVRGEPDEITKATSVNKTGALHLNQFWNYESLSTDQKREYNWKGVGSSADKYDTDLDLYQFNFMGYSGRFVIVKEGINIVAKLVSKSQNFKIDFIADNNYVISAFTITDTKGYKYTFGNVNTNDNAIEITNAYPFSGSEPQGAGGGNINASSAGSNYSFNSAWHLKKVETPNNVELASLTYTNDGLQNYNASVSVTTNRITYISGNINDILTDPYNQDNLRPRKSLSYNSVGIQAKKIASITFKDGISVDFITKANDQHPETGGKILEKVSIKNTSGVENKNFKLSYEETVDTDTIIDTYRLWLTKVTETAGSTNHDYKLYYNNKENLPGVDPILLNGDAWGYNSGISLGDLNCSSTSNTYSDNTITTGLLSAIEYPTGGVKEFVFEHNSFSYYQNQSIGFNDYMENPRNTNLQSQFTDNFVYNHTGQSAPTVTIDNFTTNFVQDINVSSWVTASPSQYLNDHRIKIYNANYSIYLELDEQCLTVTNLPAGTYTMALAPYNNLNTATYQISGDYRVTYQSSISNPKQEMIGGGVRIKEVIFKDNLFTLNPSKKLLYSYNDTSNSNVSSGVLDAKYDRLEKRYSYTEGLTLFTVPSNRTFAGATVTYDVVEKHPNIQITQGSYVGYRNIRVEELGNGYKTMEYTSPYEYPSHSDVFNLPHAKPVANLDYKRGLLLNEKVFDQQSRILKETSYRDTNNQPNYEFSEDFLFKSRYTYKKDCVHKQFYNLYAFFKISQGDVNVPNTCNSHGSPCLTFFINCGGDVPQLTTNFNSGWAKLKGSTTKEYVYEGSVQSIKEVRQEFLYNDLNYQISEQDSYYKIKGVDEHMKTKYFYPVDHNGNTGSNSISTINALIADNKVNEVIESQSYRNGTKLNETHTVYANFSTLILPKEVKVGKFTIAPEKRIEFLRYDTHGNLLEVKKTGGASISYLYGFNRSMPVAKVTNATYSSIEGVLGNTFLTHNLSPSQESSLRSALPNALISFYRYDPIKGVISTSDEKGYEMTYEYDPFNRLQRVKDSNGKILSENEYHYINQY